jgi:LPS-assembly protein
MRRATILSVIAWLATSALPLEARAAGRSSATGGGEAPVLVTADELQYDQDLGLIVAKGHVELSKQDEDLLADTVTYNQRTDTVTASGHVSILQPDGDIIFADFVELHDDMRDGFIKDARILLSDRSRIVGNTARRMAGTRTELRRGIYSPCELCKDDPTRAPVWQLKAEDIIHDKELQLVEYRDAVMEIDGFPVFFTPYFSHPDPSVKRGSGFLAPNFGIDASNGYTATFPYYLVLGPDKDATFRPIFTTLGGDILDGNYRQRWGDGLLTAEASVAVDSSSLEPSIISSLGSSINSASPAPNPTGPSNVIFRGHFASTGKFDLTDSWRTGFVASRTTDQTYLQRYLFPYTPNFLTSHAYAEDFGASSYANISAYSFQSIDPLVNDGTEPFVLPVANYTWTGEPDSFGGRLQLNGNVLDLARREGVAERRLSLGSSWRLPFNGPLGDRYVFTASLRGDGYSSDNLAYSQDDIRTHSPLANRIFPQMALNWRYPWVWQGATTNALIEPIAMIAAAPPGENPTTIPVEDSQSFEFDETDLFVPNRYPGYDRVDGGQRVDYGLHAGIYNDKAGSTQILVGQSYRLQKNGDFPTGAGLDYARSDIVGRAIISPNQYLDLIYRFRVDQKDLAMRRQESGISTGPSNLRFGMSYIYTSTITGLPEVPRTQQVSGTVATNLSQYWYLQLGDTRSIGASAATITSAAQLTYRDDCFSVTATLSQSGISFGDLRSGTSLVFAFVFRNLGEVAYQAASGGL